MIELPYIGCALTIIDPGPLKQKRNEFHAPRRYRNGELRLMKAFVERYERAAVFVDHPEPRITFIHWRAGGRRSGDVRPEDEGVEWVRGWGPMARASLLAARKLVQS